MIEESDANQEQIQNTQDEIGESIPTGSAPRPEPTPDPDDTIPSPKMEIRSFTFGTDPTEPEDRSPKEPQK